jgi:hypothetical protein
MEASIEALLSKNYSGLFTNTEAGKNFAEQIITREIASNATEHLLSLL